MALPFRPDASRVPMNVLFPEAYADSKRKAFRDLALYATCIVYVTISLAIWLG